MFHFQNKAVAKDKLKMLDVQLDKRKALISVVNVFIRKFIVKRKYIAIKVYSENSFDHEVHLLGFVLSVKVL